MSTSFYVTPRSWSEGVPNKLLDIANPGRRERPNIHLGKRAAGWRFMLHVYPEQGLTTWAEWRELLISLRLWWKIESEYGEEVTVEYIDQQIEDYSKHGDMNPGHMAGDEDLNYTRHSGDWT